MLPASRFSEFLHLDSVLLAVRFVVLNKCAYEFCWYVTGYIKKFEVIDENRVGKIRVELDGRLKDCKALTYRQDLKAKEIERYRVRMLPTRQVFCLLTSMDITCSVSAFILLI
jgi:ribosomal protein S8